ncbi:MAG: heavy-metal-associated domain-containing protein [Phycisphaeraceae bacterium]|nr:MAG: heavy-metal-associated domain-containing protein [Phycisphaeraceae bacterium]
MVGCASKGSGVDFSSAPTADLTGSRKVSVSGEEAWEHAAREEDRALLSSKKPIEGRWALLYVNGLGCPLCATNIDQQLERLPGVEGVRVDLGSGTVQLALAEGERRLSPMDLREAVADAGFTLVKVTQK